MSGENRSVQREILTYDAGRQLLEKRELAEEICLRLTVGGRDAGTLSCSPWDPEEAVIGRLFTEGMIRKYGDVRSLEIREDRVTVETAAAEPGPVPAPAPEAISSEEIISLSAQLEERSALFRRTGGVHSAALARNGRIFLSREDVSRRAALDRLAGACLSEELPMAGSVLVFSGRVAGEILEKAARMGCTAVIARSAPTDYACRLAEKAGICLVGFARGRQFNVYAHPERLSVSPKAR